MWYKKYFKRGQDKIGYKMIYMHNYRFENNLSEIFNRIYNAREEKTCNHKLIDYNYFKITFWW